MTGISSSGIEHANCINISVLILLTMSPGGVCL